MTKFVVNCLNDMDLPVMTVIIETDQEIQIEEFTQRWEEYSKEFYNAIDNSNSGDEVMVVICSFMDSQFPSVSYKTFDVPVYMVTGCNI